MAWFGKNRKGKDVCLLNPSEKGAKFATELKNGKKITNAGELKKDKNGNAIALDDKSKAYRGGYLDALKDSGNAYIAKHPRYQHKTDGGKAKAAKRKANKK